MWGFGLPLGFVSEDNTLLLIGVEGLVCVRVVKVYSLRPGSIK